MLAESVRAGSGLWRLQQCAERVFARESASSGAAGD
jgi:hypothetical protein